jgi:putative DNA primase/helicase
MRNFFNNELLGVQKIRWERDHYNKKMLYGMRSKGAVLFLGNPGSIKYYLCEGYSTGLSIFKAIQAMKLDACVVVCFSANNMVYIASLIFDKYAFIYADNDVSQTGENAAKSTGLPYIMSDKLGNDANDDMLDFGIMKVQQKIINVALHNGVKNKYENC